MKLERWHVMVGCFLYRLCFALITRTTFVPDEYFQSVEPAYNVVYSVGIMTWEWQTPFGIRSYCSVLPFSAIFRIGRFLGLDSNMFIACAPRIFVGILSGFADNAFYEICRWVCSSSSKLHLLKAPAFVCCQDISWAALGCLLVHLLSWSVSYCLSRTLANTVETDLWLIGLYVWNYRCYETQVTAQRHHNDQPISWAGVVIAAISCYIRPTALTLWVPLSICHISRLSYPLKTIFIKYIPCCIIVASICHAIDMYYYNMDGWWPGKDPLLSMCWEYVGLTAFPIPKGYIIPSPIRFLYFNIWKNFASTYFGAFPWHWYLTHGLHVMLGLYSPILFCCILTRPMPEALTLCNCTILRDMLIASLCSFACLSLSPHKEYRFLLPVLPCMHIVLGLYLAEWISPLDNHLGRDNKRRKLLVSEPSTSILPFSCPILAVCLIHFLLALYMAEFHQAGAETALSLIATADNRTRRPHPLEIHLIGPCHSFPGYSFLHSPLYFTHTHTHHDAPHVYFPDCSPTLHPHYSTENDLFVQDPLLFVQSHWVVDRQSAEPDYVVSFDCYEASVLTTLLPVESDRMTILDVAAESKPTSNATEHTHSRRYTARYRKLGSIHHSHLRYDLDDPLIKKKVHVYQRVDVEK